MSEPRLRAVDAAEPDASGGSGGGGGKRIEERLAALETRIDYLATKEDIQKIKVWVLAGVIGAVVVALGIALAILRLLPT